MATLHGHAYSIPRGATDANKLTGLFLSMSKPGGNPPHTPPFEGFCTGDVALTPPWLCGDPPLFAPGAVLFRRGNGLVRRDHDAAGQSTEACCPAGWFPHLTLFRLPGDAPPSPTPPAGKLAPLAPAAAAALAAARLGRWEGLGRAADAGWGRERLLWPDDPARDDLYAALRLAGAWGGRAAGGLLSLWHPAGLGPPLAALAAGKGAFPV
jgi:hypothetical protein